MDDLTPLRQLDTNFKSVEPFLFRPETALRARWDTNSDTPLPPDEPAAENPPDGAILDYFLPSSISQPVILAITDSSGAEIRRFSSADPIPQIDPMLDIPKYWVRPPEVLSAAPGVHRFVWDLHYPPVPGTKPDYPISAVPHDTAPSPTSPWVMPGKYQVRLSVNGKAFTQELVVKMDPHVKTSEADLAQQFTVSKQLYDDLLSSSAALDQINTLRQHLHELTEKKEKGTPSSITSFAEKLDALAGNETRRRRRAAGQAQENVGHLHGSIRGLLDTVQAADVAPTSQAVVAAEKTHQALGPLLAQWKELQEHDLPALNEQLRKARLPEISQ
jgi:hypothetical protein